DVITLARDAHRAAADDFAARTVGDASFDVILEILLNVARCVEYEPCLAGGVGPDLFALDDLPPPRVAVPVSRREVVVVPLIMALRIPPVIKRILVYQQFYSRVSHRAAEVIIGLYVDFYLVAQTKSLFSPILFRRLNADLKLGQLVLFQPEERGLADVLAT